MDKDNKKKRRLLGEILRAERHFKGIEQEELAQKLGVKQSCISKTENGSRKMDVIQLLEYCNALGITLTELSIKIDCKFSAEFSEYNTKKKQTQREILRSRKLALLQKVSEILNIMR